MTTYQALFIDYDGDFCDLIYTTKYDAINQFYDFYRQEMGNVFTHTLISIIKHDTKELVYQNLSTDFTFDTR